MKVKTRFICQSCGTVAPKWMGRCADCGEWNSIVEEQISVSTVNNTSKSLLTPRKIHDIPDTAVNRITTANAEIDRVLGGGIVKGSIVLLGGDPGIGKSTISLQLCDLLGGQGLNSLYVSGEESYEQLKLRASRLALKNTDKIDLVCETDCDAVTSLVERSAYDVVIIDSIQTMVHEGISSPPGSVSQLRENTSQLVRCAKTTQTSIILIGHVNKEGAIAGPKIIEHMVDTVLYFEGHPRFHFRLIRSIKNRFGSTNEIGIFEMDGNGLHPVYDPARYFLSEDNSTESAGSVTVAVLEGTRPILQEVQALVVPCPFGIPRRTAMGIDSTKLSIIIAVLEKYVGLKLQNQDVYVKVVGGMRIDDPASDLAVACAIFSSYKEVVLDREMIILGELGLAGEVRGISYLEARLREIAKLGLKKVIAPAQKVQRKTPKELSFIPCSRLEDVIDQIR